MATPGPAYSNLRDNDSDIFRISLAVCIKYLTPRPEPPSQYFLRLTRVGSGAKSSWDLYKGAHVLEFNSSFRVLLGCLVGALAPLVLAGSGATPAAAADLVSPAYAAAPASASDPYIVPFTQADHPFWTIDEVRVGGLDHAMDTAVHEAGGALNLEVLGGRFAGGYENSILNFLLTPRPDLGTTIGFGKTDEFYWGVTWDAKLFGPTFFEATFGGAAHDGHLDNPGYPSYGCQVNFREGASVGYAVSEHWRVLAMVDHMSNANLCSPNRGLTNAGIRLGYHF